MITALYKNKAGATTVNQTTGEERDLRFDPDVDLWHEGGNPIPVRGIKFAFVHTRRPEGRFMLGIDHVEKGRDEAQTTLGILRRLMNYTEGAQTLVWDMALSGVHLKVILEEIGLAPVVKVRAKSNPDGGKGRAKGTFKAKAADIKTIMVTMPDGTTKIVAIAAENGWVSVKEITETGEPFYHHLDMLRLQRHDDKHRYRWYGFFRLPESYGGGEVSVQFHATREDEARGLNRAENLRPFPEGSGDFLRLNTLRPDSESMNRGIEDALYINRATAKGWRAQLVDLLGYMSLVNAITLARVKAKSQIPSAA